MVKPRTTAGSVQILWLAILLSWPGGAPAQINPAATGPKPGQFGGPEAHTSAADKDPQAALDAPLTAGEQAWHVLNRMAFGPHLDELERLTDEGWQSWVEAQLDPASIDDGELERRIAKDYPSLSMSLAQAYRTYWPPMPANWQSMTQAAQNEFHANRNHLRLQIQHALRESVLVRAIASNRQFKEVIVEFWRNHFNVDQTKDDCRLFANHYEENVIRKHAFGRFGQMLMAAARHPAMLIYLDNDVSQKPLTTAERSTIEQAKHDVRIGRRQALPAKLRNLERHSGLNENYARELLELHTLGVDKYYREIDVFEVARALTGWTHGWARGSYGGHYGFKFRAEVHDTRPKNILGRSIKGVGGAAEGAAVIKMLAKHTGTARFIARKLCIYLVNDEPPEPLVKRVAQVFRATNGDLTKVYRAIVLSPEFFNRDHFRAKFKSPLEFVVSAIRSTDTQFTDLTEVLYLLGRMGQPIYQCVDPTGYFDQTEAWLDPGVLVHRWDFALRMVDARVAGLHMPDAFFAKLNEMSESDRRQHVANLFMRGRYSDRVDEIVFRSAIYTMRLVGLGLGSPMFQQQ